MAPAPAALDDRRVEITGPTDRKMTINALNSGAKIWLADFEDASAPTWENVIGGQINLIDAYERRIDFTSPEGKTYALRDAGDLATVVMRPRGWHLDERHLTVDGEPVPGGLVDFGLYFFHNAKRLIDLGKGPYFYLPKTESHLEARLWNDVFVFAQDYLGIPHGTIRATVLIETITAAFEMDEILYELRDHASGLNAGRWDYLFSIVKNFRDGGAAVRPAGPQRGDDDRALHARVHRTAGAHLPQARRARDRRHGRLHPLPPRRRGQRGRPREGQGRQGPRGRATASTAPGWPTPTWCRSPAPASTRCSATARTRRTGCARTCTVTAAELIDVASLDARPDLRRPAQRRAGRHPLHRGVAARPGRGRHLQPDGGRGDRRDLPLADLAVDQRRGPLRAAARRPPPNWSARSPPTNWLAIRAELGEEVFAIGRWTEAHELLLRTALDADYVDFLTLPAYEQLTG